MTTPTSDRSSDNESGEQSGGGHTPGPWKWIRLQGDYLLVSQCDDAPIVLDFSFDVDSCTDLFKVRDDKAGMMVPLQPNHPDAKLIASAPTLHTELHRLRSERAELLAALEGLMDGDTNRARNILEEPDYHSNKKYREAELLLSQREAAATTAIANAKGKTNE